MDGSWESRNRRDKKECFQPTLLGLSKYYASLVKPIICETLSFNQNYIFKSDHNLSKYGYERYCISDKNKSKLHIRKLFTELPLVMYSTTINLIPYDEISFPI